jgi:hypothetical protein
VYPLLQISENLHTKYDRGEKISLIGAFDESYFWRRFDAGSFSLAGDTQARRALLGGPWDPYRSSEIDANVDVEQSAPLACTLVVKRRDYSTTFCGMQVHFGIPSEI